MQNEISTIVMKKDFLGKVYGTGECAVRTVNENGTRRQLRQYAATSERIGVFVISAPVSKSVAKVGMFEELELKNPRLKPIQNSIGQGQDRNDYYEYAITVDSVTGTGTLLMDENMDAEYAALKFKNGDVTEAIDFEATFGNMYYLSSDPVFVYDNEKKEMTDEIKEYEMIVLSEKTKKPYKIKIENLDVDFSSLRFRNVVNLINPISKFYFDDGALTQGATITITAENFQKAVKPQSDSPHSSNPSQPKKQEQPKQGNK